MKRLILSLALALMLSIAPMQAPVQAQDIVPTAQEAAYLAILARPDAQFIPMLKGPRESNQTGEMLNPKIQWVLENESRPLATDAMRAYFRQSFATVEGRAASRVALDRYWALRTLETAPMRSVSDLNLARLGDHVIKARLYTPELGQTDDLPLLVYYHGGGFAFGSMASFDKTMRLIANYAKMRVMAVEYRLAPEYPYPTAFEDAQTAYFAVLFSEAFTSGSQKPPIFLGGDSAGATLALSVVHRAKAAAKLAPEGLLLYYPGVNINPDFPSMKAFGNGYGLDQENLKYLAGLIYPDPTQLQLSDISPVHADLCALPPMFVVTAGFDPLLDSQNDFVAKARAKGRSVETYHAPTLVHAFLQMSGYVEEASRASMESAAKFGEFARQNHSSQAICEKG